MEGFRNICFVHKVEDSYQVCYIRQFFKWIGFSYFSFLPGSMGVGTEILREPGNQAFDIVVSLNEAAQENDASIAQLFDKRWIDLRFQQNEAAQSILERLMEQVYEMVPKSRCTVMERLLHIYNKYHMADVLYEYTYVLMKNSDDNFYQNMLEKYQKIIAEIDQWNAQDNLSEEEINDSFVEYYLFAKYSCQRNMNGLYKLKKWSFDYPVQELIENIDEIYQYDPGFYRAEYLKAKTAEQNVNQKVLAMQFFLKCIEKSNIDVCKSYLYYHLGKWQERGKQFYDALRSYELAYQCNYASIKAVFKLAVYAERVKDTKTEIKYLNLLIENWNKYVKYKHMLPLMDIEYAYKAYRLMDDAKRVNMKDMTYYSQAQEIFTFVQQLDKEADSHSFVKNLYGMNKTYICQSMPGRMDCAILFGFDVWRNNHGECRK